MSYLGRGDVQRNGLSCLSVNYNLVDVKCCYNINFCLFSVRGNEMAQLGHYSAAIDLFTEAIKLDSRDFR